MHVPVQMAVIILGGALTAQDPSPAFFVDSPTIAEDELFGSAVACAVDRVAVGAPGHQVGSLFEAGAVFVFSADGTYERTVTAPSPTPGRGLAIGSSQSVTGSSSGILSATSGP